MAKLQEKWIVEEDNSAWDTEEAALLHEQGLAFNRVVGWVVAGGKPISDAARDELCKQLQSGAHDVTLAMTPAKKEG